MGEAVALDGGWQDRVVQRSLQGAAEHSIARAEALMGATVELLEQAGEDVTVQQIADRAGVSLRVLYRHFPSKDALLVAVIEDLLSTSAEEMRRELAVMGDPVGCLVEFILRTIDHTATPRNIALARHSFLLSVSRPGEVRRAQAPMAALARDLLIAVVDGGHLATDRLDSSTYVLLELRRTYNHSRFFGSEFGLPLPPPTDLVRYCLRSIGVEAPPTERALAEAVARRS
jgi:TetR/AcrR family transcriptional regulator